MIIKLNKFYQIFQAFNCSHANITEEEIRAKKFITGLNNEFNQNDRRKMIASWNHDSNITDENEKIKNEVEAEVAKYYQVRQLIIILTSH